MREEQEEALRNKEGGTPVWRMPMELRPARPRPVRLRGGLWVLGIFPLLIGTLLLILPWGWVNDSIQAHRLLRYGVYVDAEVTRVEERYSRKGGYRYQVYYRFPYHAQGSAPGEVSFQSGWETLGPQAARGLRAGSAVPVVYESGNPAHAALRAPANHAATWPDTLRVLLPLVVPLLIGGAMTLALLRALRERRQQRALLADGVAQRVWVFVSEMYRKDKAVVVDLSYAFRTHRGAFITGESEALDPTVAWACRQVATVLYDEARPAEHSLYPMTYVTLPDAPGWSEILATQWETLREAREEARSRGGPGEEPRGAAQARLRAQARAMDAQGAATPAPGDNSVLNIPSHARLSTLTRTTAEWQPANRPMSPALPVPAVPPMAAAALARGPGSASPPEPAQGAEPETLPQPSALRSACIWALLLFWAVLAADTAHVLLHRDADFYESIWERSWHGAVLCTALVIMLWATRRLLRACGAYREGRSPCPDGLGPGLLYYGWRLAALLLLPASFALTAQAGPLANRFEGAPFRASYAVLLKERSDCPRITVLADEGIGSTTYSVCVSEADYAQLEIDDPIELLGVRGAQSMQLQGYALIETAQLHDERLGARAARDQCRQMAQREGSVHCTIPVRRGRQEESVYRRGDAK